MKKDVRALNARTLAVFAPVTALAIGLPAASGHSSKVTVPLCAGLMIVTAVQQTDGDYESIKTVETVDPRQVRLKYSVEKMQYPGLFDTTPPFLKKIVIPRTVRR
jgi:hypothetical protein